MSLQQEYQERARAIRERLVHPPNAKIDLGIDLKRLKSGTILAEKKKPEVLEYHTTPKPVTVTQVALVVSKYFGIGLMDVMGKDRRRRPSIARQITVYLAAKHCKMSCAAIGVKMERDHTTILYSRAKIASMIVAKPGMVEVIQAIEERLFQ